MLRRAILSLAALVALVAGTLAPAAMAAPALPQPAVAEPAPVDCHMAVVASPKPAEAPAEAPPATRSPCCPEGSCDGKCTPLGAFFAGPVRHLLGFLRQVIDAPANAAPPAVRVAGAERPPRPRA